MSVARSRDTYKALSINISKRVNNQSKDCKTHFSNNAMTAIGSESLQLIDQLILGSIRIAKRDGVDSVSANHVIKASEDVFRGSETNIYPKLFTIGGILLSCTIPIVLAANQYTIAGIVAAIILAIAGISLVMFGFYRE